MDEVNTFPAESKEQKVHPPPIIILLEGDEMQNDVATVNKPQQKDETRALVDDLIAKGKQLVLGVEVRHAPLHRTMIALRSHHIK